MGAGTSPPGAPLGLTALPPGRLSPPSLQLHLCGMQRKGLSLASPFSGQEWFPQCVCAQGFHFLRVGERCQAERWEDPGSLLALTTAEQKQQKSHRPHLPVHGAAPYGDALQASGREPQLWHRCTVGLNGAEAQIFTDICRLLPRVEPAGCWVSVVSARIQQKAGPSALSILRAGQRRAEEAGGAREVSGCGARGTEASAPRPQTQPKNRDGVGGLIGRNPPGSLQQHPFRLQIRQAATTSERCPRPLQPPSPSSWALCPLC